MGVLWLIAVGFVIWLVDRLLPSKGSETNNESALEIFDQQIANHELDLPAWEARRAAVTGAKNRRK